MGDTGEQLGAPDLDPAGEILRGLDWVRGTSIVLIIPVKGQLHLTLVKGQNGMSVSII